MLAKQWIKGCLVNFICKAKWLSKQESSSLLHVQVRLCNELKPCFPSWLLIYSLRRLFPRNLIYCTKFLNQNSPFLEQRNETIIYYRRKASQQTVYDIFLFDVSISSNCGRKLQFSRSVGRNWVQYWFDSDMVTWSWNLHGQTNLSIPVR